MTERLRFLYKLNATFINYRSSSNWPYWFHGINKWIKLVNSCAEVIEEMRFLNHTVILLFFLVAAGGCNHTVKSIYANEKLARKETCYKNTYGRINSLQDTTIIDNNRLSRTYAAGLLKKIGKLDDNGPVGYWFTFEDSLELEYIINYNAGKADSFFHPFALINHRW
ncbi:MAG: hypothetical protein QM791_11120 [Ferruginibacter sp.]